MALTPGTRLGPYEILSALGAGGMGEVYRARDTKLGRDVALKLLPEAFADDPDRLMRFEREARTLASLNHPHIANIYGLEAAGATRALVMELVEGEDLSARIARGPIPLGEALSMARQMAEALEAAHEAGIIHRDLKPANIRVREDGTVKVLDFGLAKALETRAGRLEWGPGRTLVDSPTIASPAITEAGVVLGTAAYMAPEQAKGRGADKRSDVWAFGAVLFEMLTGMRPFKGDDLSDTLAAVLRDEPDWMALPASTPPAVHRLLRRCLEKDRNRRLDSAADARLEIDEARTVSATDVPGGTVSWSAGPRLAWAVAAAATVAFISLLLVGWMPSRPAAPPETRVDIVTPATDDPASFALSPDGRQIVFVASRDGVPRLWLRSLATTTAQPLAGTDGGSFPFWSPDGRSVAFFAANALKRLDLTGGQPQTLAPAANGSGGTWSAEGVIVFAPSTTTALLRVSAKGGMATPVTTLGQHAGHVAPHFLPDGTRFVFYVQGAVDTQGIYLGTMDGSAPSRLTPADSNGVPLLGEWLLWVREGVLVAQRLNVAKGALTGEPVTVADELVPGRFRSAVSVAATGLVAYRTGSASRQLIWVDRSGTERGTVGVPDGTLLEPRVSPDGRRVVVGRTVQGNHDLWLIDGPRTSRFTFDAAPDRSAAWSPDGTQIAFHSSRTGIGDLYLKPTNGAGAEERLVASDQLKAPGNWSADGRFLLFHSVDPPTNLDLWVIPVAPRMAPSLVLKTAFRESYGVFSPDSRWVAYQSNDSGRYEIYVRPFVPPGTAGRTMPDAQWPVSTAGGVHPVWRPDGKELYYLDPQGVMMAAPITVTGTTPEPGSPIVLFPTRAVGGGGDSQQRRQYDVAPDGRFLINTERDTAATPITLVLNWYPEAKK